MFWIKKATAASFALVAVFAMGIGVGFGTRTEYVSGGDGQEKIAPDPKAKGEKKVQQPVARDFDKEIEDTQKELQTLRIKNLEARLVVANLKEVVEVEKANGTDSKSYREAVAALAQAQQTANNITARLEVFEERLRSLKAAKLKADKEQTPKTHPALTELFGKPEELEEQLLEETRNAERAYVFVALQAQQLELVKKTGTPDEIKQAQAKLEQAQATAAVARHRVEELKHLVAGAKAVRAPLLKAIGVCIEVVVIADGLYRVREYGREGKFLGSVVAESSEALELIMTRAMKDPGGPRDLWMTVSDDQDPSAIRKAAEACKNAGFTKLAINGTLPKGIELPLGLQ